MRSATFRAGLDRAVDPGRLFAIVPEGSRQPRLIGALVMVRRKRPSDTLLRVRPHQQMLSFIHILVTKPHESLSDPEVVLLTGTASTMRADPIFKAP